MSDEDIKVVSVDFDGTLVEYNGWNGHEHVGRLKSTAKLNMELLDVEENIRIMINTCRAKLDPVKRKLESNNIPFDYINENPHQPDGVSSCKLFAWRYIDDRNACFESLSQSVKNVISDYRKEMKK